jgi:hypothetical protein
MTTKELLEPEQLSARAAAHDGGLRRPETSAVDLLLGVAVALFAAFWVRPFFSYNALWNDEGIIFQGAMRILRGDVLYRDFFSFYTPGSYYLYAALFRCFGATLQVARALLVVYAALFSFLTYMLARRACSRSASALAASLLALICLPSHFQNLHSWDSTAVALLSLYGAVWFLQTGATPWAFFSGLLAGATAMIEQTRGAGILLGLVIGAIALYCIDPIKWSPRRFAPAVLGGVTPLVAVVGYFAAQGALTPMLAAWFWPLHHYTTVNKLPYGYISWSKALVEVLQTSGTLERLILGVAAGAMVVVSLLPVLVLALAAAVGSKLLLGKLEATPLTRFVILTGAILFGTLIMVFATGRPDFNRMTYLEPLFFFAIPLLLDERLVRLPSLSNIQPLLIVALLTSFTDCAVVLASIGMRATHVVTTRRGLVKTNDPDQVLTYVQAHVPAGETVLFYPYAVMYSFLTATFSPTKYDFLQVGMHTPAQFEEARRQLEWARTPVVIFDLTFLAIVPETWPSTPAEVLASDPVGDFIFAHYQPCKILRSGRRPFAYMVRKDLPCPH